MFHTSREMPVRRPLRLSILAILEEGLQGIVLLLGVLAVIVVARSSGTMTIEGYSIMSLPNLVLIFQCGRPNALAIVTHL